MLTGHTGIISRIQNAMNSALAQEPFRRDPAYIAEQLPQFERVLRYFRPHIYGVDNIPRTGPFLLIGNHSGGMYTPCAYALIAAFWRTQGVERPFYGMGHNILFSSPLKDWYAKIGILPADPKNGDLVIERDGVLVVFPGGDHEAYRPFKDRNHIDFAGRKGFVRLALKHRIPIVPMVAHGSHHTLLVLSRGERMAEALNMERLRVKIFPWTVSFPWGVSPGWFPSVPLPADLTLAFCKPISWPDLGPEAAQDKAVVARCFEQVVGNMQSTLDHMVKVLPDPLVRLRDRTPENLARQPWVYHPQDV